MHRHLLLFLLCALLGVPIGATGVAYATSCAEPAVTAWLEPVEVTVDGEPVDLSSAPREPRFSRAQSGGAAFTIAGGASISLVEDSR